MKYALILAMLSVCFNVQAVSLPIFEKPTFKQRFEKKVVAFFLRNEKAEIEDPFFTGIEISNIFLRLQKLQELEFIRTIEKILSDSKNFQPYNEFQCLPSGYVVHNKFER